MMDWGFPGLFPEPTDGRFVSRTQMYLRLKNEAWQMTLSPGLGRSDVIRQAKGEEGVFSYYLVGLDFLFALKFEIPFCRQNRMCIDLFVNLAF